MISWIIENIGTIVVGLVVAAIIVVVVIKMIKDKKKGKSSCGCGCSNCPAAGACHKSK